MINAFTVIRRLRAEEEATLAYPIDKMLVVGISGRALFDMAEEHRAYETHGLKAYKKFQREREEVVLKPGTAFPVVKGLLSINDQMRERAVEVVVISRNDGDSGLRIMNSIKAHGLDITRASFCGGDNAAGYFSAYNCKLFLSAEETDVRKVILNQAAAAMVLPPPEGAEYEVDEVRIAFDADAVIFSDEAEQVYQSGGLTAFHKAESENACVPLAPGPFKRFLEALASIQSQFPEGSSPIRTAIVTARNAPAHERAIRTLRNWGIAVDEMHLLGGIEKSGVLKVFRPHIFFDDQQTHLQACAQTVPAAHVPYGVAAQKKPPMAAGTQDVSSVPNAG